jgi:U4/U6 small nuclear ribonucleoprotein SNU13
MLNPYKKKRQAVLQKIIRYLYFMQNPKAYPIADQNLSIQILDLIEIAKDFKQIKKGANEAIKCMKKGVAEIIIIASDSDPLEIVLHLPLICEDKNVPYIFILGKDALGKACGVNRPVLACSITSGINFKLNSQIRSIKDNIEKNLN